MISLIAKTLTGKEYGITREIVNSAFKSLQYSNKKITEALNISFKPVHTSILEICQVTK